MHAAHRKKYSAMTLVLLRNLRDDLDVLIKEIARPWREIDIGAEHPEDPELVHEVLQTMGEMQSGKWKQLEGFYCCH